MEVAAILKIESENVETTPGPWIDKPHNIEMLLGRGQTAG